MPKRKKNRKGVPMLRTWFIVLQRGNWNLHRTSTTRPLLSLHMQTVPEQEKEARGGQDRAAYLDFDWTIFSKSLVIKAEINLPKNIQD